MSEPGDVRLFGNGPASMEFIQVPAGDEPQAKAFWIAKHEVNQRQFSDFVKSNPEWRSDAVLRSMADAEYLQDWGRDEPEFIRYHDPVVFVSFLAAQAFCKWAGLRLPKIEEWMRAVALLPEGKGFERLKRDEQKVGNWTASVGKGNRRLVAGIEAAPDGNRPTEVSARWGFRCAADG